MPFAAWIDREATTLNHVVTTFNKMATKLNHVATTLNHVATTLSHVGTTLNHVATTLSHVGTTLNHVATMCQPRLTITMTMWIVEWQLRLAMWQPLNHVVRRHYVPSFEVSFFFIPDARECGSEKKVKHVFTVKNTHTH